jgi:hypothetical protein
MNDESGGLISDSSFIIILCGYHNGPSAVNGLLYGGGWNFSKSEGG